MEEELEHRQAVVLDEWCARAGWSRHRHCLPRVATPAPPSDSRPLQPLSGTQVTLGASWMRHSVNVYGRNGGTCCSQVLPGGSARTSVQLAFAACARVVENLAFNGEYAEAVSPAARSKNNVSAEEWVSHEGSLHSPPTRPPSKSSVRKRKSETCVPR